MSQLREETQTFQLMEATIADIQRAFAAGVLTARQLTQLYLDRIASRAELRMLAVRKWLKVMENS